MSSINCVKLNYNLSMLYIIFFQLLILSTNRNILISGKNVDHSQLPAHLAHPDSNKNNLNRHSCENVKGFFKAISINIIEDHDNKGPICSGHCCSNSTETELTIKATSQFETLFRDHTKSLRGILESTSSSFRSHVLELSQQSENKTLNVFSQVYRRMLPLSKQLIHNLYSNITSHLNSSNDYNLDSAIHEFFVNLFPVAYHQAVHLNKINDNGSGGGDGAVAVVSGSGNVASIGNGDLHDDYISCLKHTYDDLQPFGNVPKELSKSLTQSVTTATVFINALEQSADVLASTDELDSKYLTSNCQRQLMKMTYCPSCNGIQKPNVNACYSYCLNVMRGCLAQYVGVLDSPWSNVAEAIDHLVTTSIQSQNGIVTTIKVLDAKLSEAIMHAMEYGPELEKKVQKTCGKPKLIPINKMLTENRPIPMATIKWATPPESEILRFLSTIEKSKDYYSRIVNNYCEDDYIQRNDQHCWTGDRIGDYTQSVMATGVDAQRYNPEVPLSQHSNAQVTKLNELVDKLIKIRSTIGNAVPSRSYSDIQGDMAGHDEEGGSGSWPISQNNDDERYGNLHGSGDGSGDSTESDYTPDYNTPPNSNGPEIERTNDNHLGSSSSSLLNKSLPAVLVLFITCAHTIWH